MLFNSTDEIGARKASPRLGVAFLKTFLCFTGLLFWPGLCEAQQQTPITQQSILDELKAMRSSLERLEKGQRALLAVLTIQVDQGRVATLEAQRQRLSSEERDLDKQIRQANSEVRNQDAGGPTILRSLDSAPESAGRAASQARQDEATRKIEEVRRALQSIDQEIGAIKNQIAAMEKQVAESLK